MLNTGGKGWSRKEEQRLDKTRAEPASIAVLLLSLFYPGENERDRGRESEISHKTTINSKGSKLFFASEGVKTRDKEGISIIKD